MEEEFKENSKNKIAILIDGDNAQSTLIGKILAETAKYGSITIKRIYGDWTTSNMHGWKETLNNFAIQPIQQFRYTIGKNATDSAMIIDAMDILHSGLVEGFCIVSSDSDYTRLATRIRERGFFVMGVGEQKTPKAFVNACNVFIYTENLTPEKFTPRGRKGTKKEDEKSREAIPLLKEAFEMAVREDGWANLATMGIYLRQLDPGFDPRTYGYKQLSQLIKAYSDIFALKSQDETGPTTVYMTLKNNN